MRRFDDKPNDPPLRSSAMDSPRGAPVQDDTGQIVDAIAAQVLLHEILETSKVATVILTQHFLLVWTNRAAGHFLGLERATPPPPDMREILHDELREAFAEPADFVDRVLASYAAGEHLKNEECHIEARDGRPERWLEYSSQPIRFGPHSGGRIEYFTDVTERHWAERELRESERRYRQLFEQSKDMVYISHPDGRLIDVNPAGVELFGFASKEEALAMSIPEMYVDTGERQALLGALAEHGYVKDFEMALSTRTGRKMTVRGTASAQLDAHGEIVRVLGILRDVTAELELEEQLRQSQKMEAIGRLAGGIAHDFNNLLTAINGYGQLLAQSMGDSPQKVYVDEIAKAGQRAADLTANLLRISRRQALSFQVVDLGRLIVELRGMLQQMIGEDVYLTTSFDLHLGQIWVDPGQLEQVLLNLAINARDAMPTGGELEITAKNVDFAGPRFELPAGGYVLIEVRDTGTGIDPDHAPHIFEPLFTTKKKGKGTGFGLAMVYATVTRSNGAIQVDSAPGEGTTFRIYLPRVEKVDEDGVETPKDGESSAASTSLRRGDERLLLVEDDPSVRTLVQELLDQQGYEVLVAHNATAAFELIEDDPCGIELLVTDVVMPGTSGPELAERLEKLCPELKTLFISGYSDAFTSQHGLSEGRHAMLQKPFDAHQLTEKVREILDGPEVASS